MMRCDFVPGCGRVVAATRNIPGGTIIFREEAYSMAPNEDVKTIYCLHCTDKAAKEACIACERCKYYYCSQQCHDVHHIHHLQSGECDGHQFCHALRAKIPAEDFDTFVMVVLVMLRCVSEGKAKSLSRTRTESAPHFETVGLGCETTSPLLFLRNRDTDACVTSTFDHVECLATNLHGTNAEIVQDFVHLHKIYCGALNSKKAAGTVKNAHVPFPADVSEDVFVSLACAFLCNGFGVWDSVNRKKGTALYPQSSYFNHSCSPNVGRMNVSQSRQIAFFAARDVQQGEPLCISYVDVKLPAEERIAKLQATYSFSCICPRCDPRADDDVRNTLCGDMDPVLCEDCLSKVIQPIGEGRYLCPHCHVVQTRH